VSSEELAVPEPGQIAVPRRLRVIALARRRSEPELVRAARRGDAQAVDELFRRHWPAAYRAAYLVVGDRAAAEDIAQEAFVKALAALDRFDRRRPLAPWLHRIAVNRAIDWTRARALRREDAEPGEPAGAPYAGHEGGLSQELVTALRQLSAEHRAVVVLRYLLEYTPGEIAAMLELPRGTVNSRLRRALDALERALGERP
jgi:RNA polymerase sigma-70 factor, ECF subfamily